MITPEDIQKLANLSRIDISEEEKISFSKEIDSILLYVSQISDLAVQTEIDNNIFQVRNVFRADGEPHESGLYTADLIKGAPKNEKGFVKVRKIISHD